MQIEQSVLAISEISAKQENKIWKIKKRGEPNKKGVGGGGPTKTPKINKRLGLLFGTGQPHLRHLCSQKYI